MKNTNKPQKAALGLKTAIALALGGALVAPAVAEVPSSVANRLGRDLTPIGAEKAGSNNGVAAWTGRAINGSRLLAGFDGGALPNPYGNDKKLYTVTADNMARYARVLSDGQKAMLNTYRDNGENNGEE